MLFTEWRSYASILFHSSQSISRDLSNAWLKWSFWVWITLRLFTLNFACWGSSLMPSVIWREGEFIFCYPYKARPLRASCISFFLAWSAQEHPEAGALCFRWCCGCGLVAAAAVLHGSLFWAQTLGCLQEVWGFWFSFSGGAEMSHCAKTQIQHVTIELNPNSILKICAFGLHST